MAGQSKPVPTDASLYAALFTSWVRDRLPAQRALLNALLADMLAARGIVPSGRQSPRRKWYR